MGEAADFFVSHTSADTAWAEWIAWQLEAEGYTVAVQAWDFTAGRDWAHEMQQATSTAERVLAVLSTAYLRSAHGGAEWRAFYAKDPSGEHGLLLPVRVEEVDPPGLLKTRIYVDLVDQDAAGARQALLAAARGSRGRASAGGADWAGWRGQDAACGGACLPPAGAYDLVWWVRGEQPTTLLGHYAGLASQPPLAADLQLAEDASRDAVAVAVRGWLERHRRWLLVLDNVEEPQAVAELLPRGASGHVLLTSQAETGWEPLADSLAVDALAPADAAGFLLTRTRQQGLEAVAAATTLARALGGLPLALEQAGAFVASTGMVTLAAYAELFATRAPELLNRGQPLGYQHTVTTTWSLALQHLREAAQPALGQRHLLLHQRPIQGGHGQLVGADPQMQRVGAADAGQRLPQRPVDIDVGRAAVMHLAVQGLRQHIQAGVDPTAARERLKPQAVPVARHHWVAQPDPPRLVVAGLGDIGHRQQPSRDLLGPGQEPGEEPRVGRRTGDRDPTRGLQHRPPASRVDPRPLQIRIGVLCRSHAQRLQTTPDNQRAPLLGHEPPMSVTSGFASSAVADPQLQQLYVTVGHGYRTWLVGLWLSAPWCSIAPTRPKRPRPANPHRLPPGRLNPGCASRS
jgi:hypothetical protein